jgi:hypothetical protein
MLGGQHQRPNLFQDFPKFRPRRKAHGSISIQEGQPQTSLILPRIFIWKRLARPSLKTFRQQFDIHGQRSQSKLLALAAARPAGMSSR